MKPLFIHIPKTAGSSLWYLNKKINLLPSFLYGHQSQYEQEILCEIHNYKPNYCFTIVRNPYTRIISIYNYLRDRVYFRGSRDEIYTDSELVLEEWVEKFIVSPSKKARSVCLNHHFTPQVCFLNGKSDVNIFKFEELDKLEDFFRIKLPHANASNNKYQAVHTEKSIEFVRKYYKDDFERFGYEL
jgi:hypothetical protein